MGTFIDSVERKKKPQGIERPVYIASEQPPTKGQRFLFDDHRDAPRGFGLRITAAGGKAFILKYTVDGRQRRKTIGDWPTWSLEAAREEARELLFNLTKHNIDPLAEKARRKSDPTVKDAVETFTQTQISALVSAAAIKRYLERDLVGPLSNVKIADVRRRDIIEIVTQKAEDTPTAARHLLAYLKTFFDWCIDQEYIDASPAAIKPKSIKPGGKKNALKPVKRERVLDDDEIKAFWNAVDDCGMSRLTALALKLILVTGQRPGEVAGMREEEIDGDVWVIPASRRLKTETENRVPLTPLALSIIQQARDEIDRLQKRRKAEQSGFIFEARKGMAVSVGALSKALIRYQDALGMKEKPPLGRWRPHDLRRTCRTGLSACGVSTEIAERVIGHAAQGIEGVYNQHKYDVERRSALEAWERRLLNVVQGADPDASNVVTISRGATA